MKRIKWNSDKEDILISDASRGNIGFADCVIAIDEGRILDILPHPTKEHQQLLILNIENYAYVVPFVREDNGNWFLKTVFPSRKFTTQYLTPKKP